MRVAWGTDIHLNFVGADGARLYGQQVARTRPDAFIVSGDIAEATNLTPLLRTMAEGARLPCDFVLGNHDFYRSDIDTVRAEMTALSASIGSYLSVQPARELMDGVAITGVDGWGDARLGNPEGTDVRLNDFLMIRDLATPDWSELLARLRRLGDQEAALAQTRLDEAFQLAKHVLFVTHVPPFRAACWHDGEVSNDAWLPFFTCDAVGKVLRHAARENPDRHITVLCGHTHSAGEVHVGPNLHVFTGRADYGTPAFDLLEVSATGVGFAD